MQVDERQRVLPELIAYAVEQWGYNREYKISFGAPEHAVILTCYDGKKALAECWKFRDGFKVRKFY